MTSEELRIIEGYKNLLVSIRKLAEEEGELADFMDYWFYSPNMLIMWRIICSESKVVIDGLNDSYKTKNDHKLKKTRRKR